MSDLIERVRKAADGPTMDRELLLEAAAALREQEVSVSIARTQQFAADMDTAKAALCTGYADGYRAGIEAAARHIENAYPRSAAECAARIRALPAQKGEA